MSKHHINYSQQYNKPNESANVDTVNDNFIANTNVNVAPINVDPEPTIPTPPAEPEIVYGKVCKCKALNVREEADMNSEKVCVLPVGSKVVVNNIDTAGEWFSICTEAGLEGYCLSEYISIE